MSLKLLGIKNAKTIKGEDKGYLTGILYLLPHRYSGYGNVCPNATIGCSSTCLNFAGRGQMPQIQEARKWKNKLFREHPTKFITQIEEDIKVLEKKANRENRKLAIRLNGTSDLPWENLIDMSTFPNIQFYDYTKSYRRMLNLLSNKLPPNYYLAFSRSEKNSEECKAVLSLGGSVAVVLDKIPENRGYQIRIPEFGNWDNHSDGDANDLIFLNRKSNWFRGKIITLKAKGRARKDTTGFVVRNAEWR